MPGHIRVQCLTVGEFLSGDRRLTLPWFQRSYAWGERQIGRLMADVEAAMDPATGRNRYFLGHVYLARSSDQTADQLVDGNQRVTTLTILFSILRDLAEGDDADALHSHVAVGGNDAGGEVQFRLNPQPSVAPFLARYVQSAGATRVDVDDDLISMSHAEQAIFNNREDLKSMLSAWTPSARAALAEFVRSACCLTVSTVDDPDEAWDMLATEEETSLEHHDTDRAKHSLLSPMPRRDQVEASRIWDTWVTRVGQDRARELLGHIRTIGSTRRSTKPIEEDLIRMFRLDRTGLVFIQQEFAPRAAWMERIDQKSIGAGTQRDVISRRIQTLSWLDQPLWKAPAIRWLETRGEAAPETAEFFFALDRLAWLLKISGTDPVAQERRFIEICQSIGGNDPGTALAKLAPETKLIKAAVSNLRSRTFEVKRYSDLVLRRISLELGQDPGPLDPEGVTIEHILPRNPAVGSEWWQHFRSSVQITEFANRLGNLTFLTRQDNQLASTRGYPEKRRILSLSRFVMAREAAEASEWTPDTIKSRTERLLGVLLSAWRL